MSEKLDAAVRTNPSTDPGLLARGRRFVGALLEHVATRGELLAVELAEEKERLIHTLVAVSVLLAAVVMVLVFAGVLALVLAWDTSHRDLVAWLIPIVFLILAGGAWIWLKSLLSKKVALFRDSLKDLKQDAKELRA
ncbi:MAG: phage holin family protein [Casimicrobiaceae bacterium]